jgi:hypothetical protein
MIKPVNFSFNAETAVNNAFQAAADEDAQDKALAEFENMVKLLRDHGISVTVIEDSQSPFTPDSIFPNNWISFHKGNIICLYPMFARSRRLERKPGVLEFIRNNFQAKETIDFSHYENENLFLEGTGSMVLDRDNMIVYACLSPRTDLEVVNDFCQRMGYKSVTFTAVDEQPRPIYHTNVMMCVADRYVVICLDSIPNPAEKENVISSIMGSVKEIIPITLEQMNHFAGNMLQVNNISGEKFLVMSSQAFHSLTPKQVDQLEKYNPIIHSPLDTIEKNGGGSARCMMAEVFLSPR